MRFVPFTYMKENCIKPFLTNKTITIANGGSFSNTYFPANPPDIVPSDITYTWSVVDNPNVTGETNQTISQTSFNGGPLTNISGTSQAVVYTVTPRSGNCIGNTFRVTVTVLA